MREIKKSTKLDNVLYDVRGPVVEEAERMEEAGARILRELTGDLSSDEALASVVEQLRSHDVLEETRQLARTWADEAVAALAPLPKGEAKTALEAFANLMVDRLV